MTNTSSVENPTENLEKLLKQLDFNPFSLLGRIRYHWYFLRKAWQKKEVDYLTFNAFSSAIYGISRFPVLKYITTGRLQTLSYELIKIEQAHVRTRVFKSLYRCFRLEDEIVDGDMGNLSPLELRIFTKDLEQRFKTENWESNALDFWFADLLEASEQLGLRDEIRSCCIGLLKTLEWDAERRADFLETGERSFPTHKELTQHYYELDCLYTGKGMLYIFGECPDDFDEEDDAIQRCFDLATATRHFYDIRDLRDEVRNGLVNISQAEASEYGITMEMLEDFAFKDLIIRKPHHDFKEAPLPIKNWLTDKLGTIKVQMQRAQILMGEESPFGEAIQILLREIYYPPLERFVSQMEKIV